MHAMLSGFELYPRWVPLIIRQILTDIQTLQFLTRLPTRQDC